MPTADLDLERLERLCAEATPGPWFIQGGHNDYDICGNQTGTKDGWAIADRVFHLDVYTDAKRQERDAEFVIAARTALPLAIARIRELEAESERHRKAAVRFAKNYMLTVRAWHDEKSPMYTSAKDRELRDKAWKDADDIVYEDEVRRGMHKAEAGARGEEGER